jgi:hypothetical protein
LFSLTDRRFKSLKIINKATLKEQYGVSDKEYGVVIKAKRDKHGINPKKK